jgi:hypothetical protein
MKSQCRINDRVCDIILKKKTDLSELGIAELPV